MTALHAASAGMSGATTPGASMATAAERSLIGARLFRRLLNALARPGRPTTASPEGLAPVEALAPLSPAAAAVLLTLADADAPYWLTPSRAAEPIERALRFATGTGPAPSPETAAFCCGSWPELAETAASAALIGDPEYPDRSTTLVVEVDSLTEGAEARLTGPGVKGSEILRVRGVDDRFWRLLERNKLLFPLGIDVFLTCGETLVGLPRSTLVETL